METMIDLSLCLIAGLLVTRLVRQVDLPAVTAYLVAGLLLGPFLIGALQIPDLGFHTIEAVDQLDIICQVALGFIAFTIGNEFRIGQLRTMGRQAVTVGILQAVGTTVMVDICLIGLHLIWPESISIPAAITLGSIAAATAPAATLMVVQQYRAEGPMTRLLLMVVAIDDAVGLMLFSVSYGIATALESGEVSAVTVLVEPLVEICLSLGLGALAGLALYWTERAFHSWGKRLSISIGFVLMAVGLSMEEFQVGAIYCRFSLLLVCMMTGTVFCNICDFSQELMDRVESWTSVLYVLFFVLSGAALDLSVLSVPTVLLVGAVYILSRALGKYLGAYGSCALTGCDRKIRKNLGITLLPQAGVALGMAITAETLSDGAVVRSVVLFSVLVYELVGPALTKRALIAAGEIHGARSVSRRKREHRPAEG